MKIKVNGGIKEAAKLLQGLKGEARKRVIEDMIAKNPELTDEILAQMVTLEDLIHLTPAMMRDLSREIDLEELALALRTCSKELIDHILGLVSSNNQKDMIAIIKGKPQSVDKVEAAGEKILKVVRKMVDNGQLILNDDETYV